MENLKVFARVTHISAPLGIPDVSRHYRSSGSEVTYDRQSARKAYRTAAFRHYQRHHMDRATTMIVKAMGYSGKGLVSGRLANSIAWWQVSRWRGPGA